MNDFSTLGKRIKFGLEKEGKSQADLSKYTGIKSATVSQWCSDKVKALKSDNALRVAKFLRVNNNWLVTGKGSPFLEDIISIPDDVLPPDGYIQIKEYALKCGAGPGTTPTFDEINDTKPASYQESFFKSLGINPKDCKRFSVDGDSMIPTLYPNDKILVNTADNQKIDNNKVYAIVIDDEVRVKRLIRKINGDLIIRSDNAAYQDEIIEHDNENIYFSIIGRVVEKSGCGGL